MVSEFCILHRKGPGAGVGGRLERRIPGSLQEMWSVVGASGPSLLPPRLSPPLFPRGLRSLLEALTPAEALNLADPRQGLGCREKGNSNTENRVSVKVCKPEMSRNSI